MTDETSDRDRALSDSFLATTREMVERSVEDDTLDDDRDAFFEALFMLQSGDVDAAIDGFRSAVRTTNAPFNALSMVSLAECHRISGREAAAIREWKKIADDHDAPRAARYVAWLSLAAMAEKRQDRRLLQQANDALDPFPDS